MTRAQLDCTASPVCSDSAACRVELAASATQATRDRPGTRATWACVESQESGDLAADWARLDTVELMDRSASVDQLDHADLRVSTVRSPSIV